MAHCPDGVPWWRVVTKSGGLAVHKLDARLASEQRTRLEAEGVPFDGDRVDMDRAQWMP
jgi:alkylated DNA nucleotide flippase Atl1